MARREELRRRQGGGSSDGGGSRADGDACIQGPGVSSGLRRRLLCNCVWSLRSDADESIHKKETRTWDTDLWGPKGRVKGVMCEECAVKRCRLLHVK